MNEPHAPGRANPPCKPRRPQFGLRGLLATVLGMALVFGALAREHRRAGERTAIASELAPTGFLEWQREPTVLCMWLRKHLPGREKWVEDRIGKGWFYEPVSYRLHHAEEARLPLAIARLRRLDTLRVVELEGGLSERGVASLRDGLPGVLVVAFDDPEWVRLNNTRALQTHFAAGVFAIDAVIALALVGTGVGVVRSYLIRRRTGQAARRLDLSPQVSSTLL